MLRSGLQYIIIGASLMVMLYIYIYDESGLPRPNLDLQKWWGPGKGPKKEDSSIKSFEIDFNDTMITDLKQRLINKRSFTRTLEGVQSEYGMNSEYLEQTIGYWLNEYDFKKRAQLLNAFPHYKTRIQGLDIHYIRVTPQNKRGLKILPLLMLHGWPSSSKEFVKIIPLLTTPSERYNFVFEVIAADLPGFGFSEGTTKPGAFLQETRWKGNRARPLQNGYKLYYTGAPGGENGVAVVLSEGLQSGILEGTTKPGLNPVQMAIIMRNLMLRLGIGKFYIQAGDWGSQCASHLATLFPENVLGFHNNMPLSSRSISMVKLLIGSLLPHIVDPRQPGRVYPLKDLFSYVLRESGYFHIQATKPDTIGYALTDSPAGLAAYIMEKMAVCTNRDQLDTPHGGLESLDIDDVLDTITIMWMNECIVTSMRIYAEGSNGDEVSMVHELPTRVPTAAIKFRYEVLYQPDWLLRDKYYNLVRSTIVDNGGHFAALQTPHVLANDVFEATVEFLKFHQR